MLKFFLPLIVVLLLLPIMLAADPGHGRLEPTVRAAVPAVLL